MPKATRREINQSANDHDDQGSQALPRESSRQPMAYTSESPGWAYPLDDEDEEDD